MLLRQAAPLASARGRCAAAPQTPRCIRRRRRDGVCAAKTSRRSVPDPFPPPPKAAGWTTARDSTGRDETAPAGYLIAAGQQKREGITPLTPVPRPLLLSVLALQGWRLCRLSPAPRGKCHPTQGVAEAQNRPRPVAGWADAPLPGPAAQGAPILPGGERRLGTGHETNGGPSRSPPAQSVALEGVQGPPWSIFGHFLLIKKVATWASGFCLTFSQTTALPMAQGKTSPDFRCDRSITRMKA